jgi:hypothetical protein
MDLSRMDASLGVDAQRTEIIEAVFFHFVQRSASEKQIWRYSVCFEVSPGTMTIESLPFSFRLRFLTQHPA